ncbi:unnamed protein product, partial [Nesidiocoris tenuis]
MASERSDLSRRQGAMDALYIRNSRRPSSPTSSRRKGLKYSLRTNIRYISSIQRST